MLWRSGTVPSRRAPSRPASRPTHSSPRRCPSLCRSRFRSARTESDSSDGPRKVMVSGIAPWLVQPMDGQTLLHRGCRPHTSGDHQRPAPADVDPSRLRSVAEAPAAVTAITGQSPETRFFAAGPQLPGRVDPRGLIAAESTRHGAIPDTFDSLCTTWSRTAKCWILTCAR